MRFIPVLAASALLCGTPAVLAQQSHIVNPDNLVQVSAHAWVIKGGTNIGIVAGDRATLVIETGLGTPNGKIIAGIAEKLSTKGQKLYLTTTHYHAEHATGDDGFPPNSVLIRPKVQQAELEAEGQKLIDIFSARSEQDKTLLQGFRYRSPGITFDKEYRLDLGGVQVRLLWLGAAHTKGDELIFVDQDGVLFSGDVVQNKTGPYFYCADCTPRSWLAVLDRVALLHPDLVVPDHSNMGDGTLVTQERAFMADLQSRAMALKSRGKSADEAGKILDAEFQAKYQGWTGMGRIAEGVQKAYSDTGHP